MMYEKAYLVVKLKLISLMLINPFFDGSKCSTNTFASFFDKSKRSSDAFAPLFDGTESPTKASPPFLNESEPSAEPGR